MGSAEAKGALRHDNKNEVYPQDESMFIETRL